MIVKLDIQDKGEKAIECDNFDLQKAYRIISGSEVDEKGNRVPGVLVGDKNYFRALEIKSIEVE